MREARDCNGPEACGHLSDNIVGALVGAIVGTGLVARGAVGAGITMIRSLRDAPEPSTGDQPITAEPATFTAPGLRPATLSGR